MVEDKDDWASDPYMTYQGIAIKGTSKMAYGRIDYVTTDAEAKFVGSMENIHCCLTRVSEVYF